MQPLFALTLDASAITAAGKRFDLSQCEKGEITWYGVLQRSCSYPKLDCPGWVISPQQR